MPSVDYKMHVDERSIAREETYHVESFCDDRFRGGVRSAGVNVFRNPQKFDLEFVGRVVVSGGYLSHIVGE